MYICLLRWGGDSYHKTKCSKIKTTPFTTSVKRKKKKKQFYLMS